MEHCLILHSISRVNLYDMMSHHNHREIHYKTLQVVFFVSNIVRSVDKFCPQGDQRYQLRAHCTFISNT